MTNSKSIVKTKGVIGVNVKNPALEDLGQVEEIMLDKREGTVRYVVLSFGGFLGMGDKLFAIPWNAFHFDPAEDCFILNVDKEKLKNAPGFDKDHWPNTTDRLWEESIFKFYGTKPYWKDKL
jgi:hypothetical protein